MKDGVTRQNVIGRFGFLLALLVSGAFLFATHGKATVAYAACEGYSIATDDVSTFCDKDNEDLYLLGFFNTSVEKALLEGTGKTKRIRKQQIELMRQLLKRACELIAIDPEFYDVAAILLQTAYERCDGNGSIKDWVRGPEKEELRCRLKEFIRVLQGQDAQPSE